jgi:hypothetical protein
VICEISAVVFSQTSVASALGSLELSSVPAWRPFIDPIPGRLLHAYWWILLLPMALGVSGAYKAVRVDDLDRFARETLTMTLQVIAFMILLGACAFALVEIYLRLIVGT